MTETRETETPPIDRKREIGAAAEVRARSDLFKVIYTQPDGKMSTTDSPDWWRAMCLLDEVFKSLEADKQPKTIAFDDLELMAWLMRMIAALVIEERDACAKVACGHCANLGRPSLSPEGVLIHNTK